MSSRRCSSQPISWLALKKINLTQQKQTTQEKMAPIKTDIKHTKTNLKVNLNQQLGRTAHKYVHIAVHHRRTVRQSSLLSSNHQSSGVVYWRKGKQKRLGVHRVQFMNSVRSQQPKHTGANTVLTANLWIESDSELTRRLSANCHRLFHSAADQRTTADGRAKKVHKD